MIFLILLFNIGLILIWSLFFYHIIKKNNIIELIEIHNSGHGFSVLTRIDQNRFNKSPSQC